MKSLAFLTSFYNLNATLSISKNEKEGNNPEILLENEVCINSIRQSN